MKNAHRTDTEARPEKPRTEGFAELRAAAEAVAVQPRHRFRWNGHHLPSIAANSVCDECGESKASIVAIRAAYEKAVRDPGVILDLLNRLDSRESEVRDELRERVAGLPCVISDEVDCQGEGPHHVALAAVLALLSESQP